MERPLARIARWTLAGLTAVALLPGCAYLKNRGSDFSEIFHVGLGISTRPGVKGSARVSVFSLQGGWMPDSLYLGSDHAYAFWWRERCFGIPFFHTITDRWQGDPVPREESVDGYLADDTYFVILVPVEDRRTAHLSDPMATVVSATQVEVGLHAAFVGLSLGVNLAQLVDFLAGLATFDLLSDDTFVPAPSDDDEI